MCEGVSLYDVFVWTAFLLWVRIFFFVCALICVRLCVCVCLLGCVVQAGPEMSVVGRGMLI